MFKKILVPLDLTERHQPVLDAAADLAVQSNGEIILLHVIATIAGWSDDEVEGFYRRIETTARQHLDEYGRQLDDRRISWHSKVITGIRAAEVVRYAGEVNADLIIVSSPSFDPRNPTEGWASLSWKISGLSSCPVLLMKTSEPESD